MKGSMIIYSLLYSSGYVKFIPWESKGQFNDVSQKTIVLVGTYNQPFQGTIISMVGLTYRVYFKIVFVYSLEV